jgi:hypothetical protein
MTTPKPARTPQRKERNAFQAGCREFESRPPLQEFRITTTEPLEIEHMFCYPLLCDRLQRLDAGVVVCEFGYDSFA